MKLDRQALKNWRWYDAVSYGLNKVFVAHNAQMYANLSYGEHHRHTLDLFVPHQARTDGALLVFVHGGSWQRGSKDDYIFLAQNLAKDGFHVALINYRLAPQDIFPSFVDDTVDAINWLQATTQAQQFGYNPEKLILLGHSAGAFNVLSAIYPVAGAHKITKLQGVYAVIAMAGPYSFEHRGDPVAGDAFAQDLTPEAIMPNYFVYPNHIKHLLLLAQNDNLVNPSNTHKMAQALQAQGNQVDVVSIARTQHLSIIATLAKGLDRWFSTKQTMLKFIDAEH